MTVIKRREGTWPTPTARDAAGCSPNEKPRDKLCFAIERGVMKSRTFPTPRSLSLCGGSGAYQQIKSNPNLTAEEKRGLTSTHGQLNPDWVEWLMAWPIGWTDLETPNVRLVWLDPSIDPADYGEIPRITNRRDNRPARIKALGNGQFPLTAAVALWWGCNMLTLQKARGALRWS